MRKLLLIIAGIAWSCANGFSQDTIIDDELNEIIAKVIEITDNEIKYRKWENLQGPLYNLPRHKVLMVLYENGEREIFREVAGKPDRERNNLGMDGDKFVGEELNLVSKPTIGLSTSDSPNYLKESEIGTSITKRKVDYQPTRLNVGMEPFHIGSDTELAIIGNAFNLGIGYLYYFPPDLGIVSSQYVNIYGSIYLPVNLVLKNYDKQDKGFFPFVHLGYGAHELIFENDYIGTRDIYYSHGFVWKFGLDYLFTDTFGVTLTSYEGRNTVFGMVFSF